MNSHESDPKSWKNGNFWIVEIQNWPYKNTECLVKNDAHFRCTKLTCIFTETRCSFGYFYYFTTGVNLNCLTWGRRDVNSGHLRSNSRDNPIFIIFIKHMIILIPGGAETPLRLSVPPINTKFISSPEHWNTSTYLNIRLEYMGWMTHNDDSYNMTTPCTLA